MNRTLVNIIIDLVAALLFLGMIATGYLLRFPLPPGSNKTHVLWGLGRHQWGDVHFWISVGLLLTLLVHLALHWNWIVTVIGKRCGAARDKSFSLVRSAAWTVAVLVVLCFGFAWLVEVSVKTYDRPMQRQHRGGSGLDSAAQTGANLTPGPDSVDVKLVWQDVYPIFVAHCMACHGPQTSLANLRVDRRQDFFKADAPLVLPGQGEQSLLIQIVSGQRNNMPMAERHLLPKSEVLRIKNWIDQGAN